MGELHAHHLQTSPGNGLFPSEAIPNLVGRFHGTLAPAPGKALESRKFRGPGEIKVCKYAISNLLLSPFIYAVYKMGFRALITFAALGLTAAETSVVSLFIPADPQPLVASIIAEVGVDLQCRQWLY